MLTKVVKYCVEPPSISKSTLAHDKLLKVKHGDGQNAPIEDRAAERTGRARTTKEEVPNGVRELRCLSIGREASGSSRTTQRNGDNLALGLASLNA